eukprot:m.485867 g.485867  ORF g.485867 m.485867 type:complete len:503 (+) comp24050_c0_seq1:309-1817(+)
MATTTTVVVNGQATSEGSAQPAAAGRAGATEAEQHTQATVIHLSQLGDLGLPVSDKALVVQPKSASGKGCWRYRVVQLETTTVFEPYWDPGLPPPPPMILPDYAHEQRIVDELTAQHAEELQRIKDEFRDQQQRLLDQYAVLHDDVTDYSQIRLTKSKLENKKLLAQMEQERTAKEEALRKAEEDARRQRDDAIQRQQMLHDLLLQHEEEVVEQASHQLLKSKAETSQLKSTLEQTRAQAEADARQHVEESRSLRDGFVDRMCSLHDEARAREEDMVTVIAAAKHKGAVLETQKATLTSALDAARDVAAEAKKETAAAVNASRTTRDNLQQQIVGLGDLYAVTQEEAEQRSQTHHQKMKALANARDKAQAAATAASQRLELANKSKEALEIKARKDKDAVTASLVSLGQLHAVASEEAQERTQTHRDQLQALRKKAAVSKADATRAQADATAAAERYKTLETHAREVRDRAAQELVAAGDLHRVAAEEAHFYAAKAKQPART